MLKIPPKFMTEEEARERLQALWECHRAARFPPELLGHSVDGIELVLLDADIAGCVSTFLKTGDLDVWRTAVLGLCYHEAENVVPVLNKGGVKYFWRLACLAELVLREVARKNKHLRTTSEQVRGTTEAMSDTLSDTPNVDNIFARIARGDMTVPLLYEDDFVMAFHDIAPQAPVHALVIPKRPVENILNLTAADREMAGALLLACAHVARLLGVAESGVRVVMNAGTDAGQTVPHLHAHVLGGRALGWPPG